MHRRQSTVKANLSENVKPIDYDYTVGHQNYVKQDGLQWKMDGPNIGPFPIIKVFTNDTVCI